MSKGTLAKMLLDFWDAIGSDILTQNAGSPDRIACVCLDRTTSVDIDASTVTER